MRCDKRYRFHRKVTYSHDPLNITNNKKENYKLKRNFGSFSTFGSVSKYLLIGCQYGSYSKFTMKHAMVC